MHLQVIGLVLSLVSMILDTADFEDPGIKTTNRSLKVADDEDCLDSLDSVPSHAFSAYE